LILANQKDAIQCLVTMQTTHANAMKVAHMMTAAVQIIRLPACHLQRARWVSLPEQQTTQSAHQLQAQQLQQIGVPQTLAFTASVKQQSTHAKNGALGKRRVRTHNAWQTMIVERV
jgi:hypothetical protein